PNSEEGWLTLISRVPTSSKSGSPIRANSCNSCQPLPICVHPCPSVVSSPGNLSQFKPIQANSSEIERPLLMNPEPESPPPPADPPKLRAPYRARGKIAS